MREKAGSGRDTATWTIPLVSAEGGLLSQRVHAECVCRGEDGGVRGVAARARVGERELKAGGM